MDGGDPRVAASPRDVVFAAPAAALAAAPPPPSEQSEQGAEQGAEAPRLAGAREVFRSDWRAGGVAWGDARLALAYDSRYKCRTSRVFALAPGPPGGWDLGGARATTGDAVATAQHTPPPPPPPRLLLSRDYEDAYADVGSPATRRLRSGAYVLAIVEPDVPPSPADAAQLPPYAEVPGRRLLFQGSGASPEGLRPFMDLFDLDSCAAASRIFASTGDQLAVPSSIISDVDDRPSARRRVVLAIAPLAFSRLSLPPARHLTRAPQSRWPACASC